MLSFFNGAAHGFGESDFDLEFQVAARLALVGGLRGILAAEKLAEKIAETGASASFALAAAKIKAAEIEVNVLRASAATVTAGARRRSSALSRDVEAELVVHLALLGV